MNDAALPLLAHAAAASAVVDAAESVANVAQDVAAGIASIFGRRLLLAP